MALESIPVWTIPPDWANPVTETLEWLTTIFSSVKGAEQRQSLRLSPRRSIEISVTAIEEWRTYLDALLSTADQTSFYVPLWHDRATLRSDVIEGAGTIQVRGDRVEMQQAIILFIQGREPWSYDILEVTSVAVIGGDTVFTLTGVTTSAWPRNTPVYAVAIGAIITQPSFNRFSDTAYQATIRFDFTDKNDWPGEVSLPTYRSFPVVELETDESEQQTGSYFRIISSADNTIGLRTRIDFAGLGFSGSSGTNFVVGRARTDELRSLLYALRGRRNFAWFASPSADFTLALAAHSADTAIIVTRCGFTDVSGIVNGRQDIRIALRDGTILYRRITASSIRSDGVTESIGLDSALGGEIRPEAVRRISFLSPGRLDQDLITLTHQTDTDGVCGATLAFKTVPDLRTGEDWFPPPFPLSNRGDCGPTIPGTLWFRFDDGPFNGRSDIDVSIGEGAIDISSTSATPMIGNLLPVITTNTGFADTPQMKANFGDRPFNFAPPYRAAAYGASVKWDLMNKSASMTIGLDGLTASTGSEETGAYARADAGTDTQFGFRYFELEIITKPQNLYIGFTTTDGAHNISLLDGTQVLYDGAGVTIGGDAVMLEVSGGLAGHTLGVLIYTGAPL